MKRTLVLLFSMCLLLSCSEKKGDKSVITVTIEPLRYFVEQIVGDKAEIVTLVPSGSSPETYEPTAQQMVALSKSMLFVKVGDLGFERTWTEKIQGLSPSLVVVDSSKGIAAVESSSRGVTDQHTWMSCDNALVIAKNIYESLSQADASNKAYYEQRYKALTENIVELDAKLDSMLQNIQVKTFIIYHPALTYFAKEYGLQQLAVEEDGREPSAATLAAVIDKAKAEDVKMMLVQKEFDRRNAEIVVQALGGIDMVTIDPLSPRWNEEMLNIGRTIATQGNKPAMQ